MKIETQDISFSLDQPDQMLSSLIRVLQQILGVFKMQALKRMPDYRNLLIIDEYERARYLAHLLVQAGYRPVVMATALEAFTRFLQIPFVPFAIILGENDVSNRLFLLRLLQQVEHKYEWDIPLIRLHYQSSTSASSQYSHTSIPQLPSRLIPQSTEATLPPVSLSSPSQPPINPSIPTLSPVSLPSPAQPPINPFLSQRTTASLPRISRVKLTGISQSGISQSLPFSTQSDSQQTPDSMAGPISQEFRAPIFPFAEVGKGEDKMVPRISLADQNIGRYHILTALGNSSTSNVYRTYDRLRETDVALKAVQTNALPYHIIERSLEEYDFFQQEMDLLRNIVHPHIVRVWNCGKSYVSGASFIYKTMPYYADGSLAQWLFQRGSAKIFSPKDVCHVVLQLADALQFLHDRQMTFQNFKLSNLLVRKSVSNMNQLHLMFVDFAGRQDGAFFSKAPGSFAYVAPEHWYGLVSPGSDQYGLAVVAYELLTGKLPFQASSEQIMKLLHTSMKPQSPSVYNPAISPSLDSILLRALSKKPQERFSSVAIFAKNFQKYAL
jgi:Protein kinase domain